MEYLDVKKRMLRLGWDIQINDINEIANPETPEVLCDTSTCHVIFIKKSKQTILYFERAPNGRLTMDGGVQLELRKESITPKNPQDYKLAAERGDADMCVRLGRAYAQGDDDVAQDGKEAVKWFKKAVKRGNLNTAMDAAEWLVIMYRGKLGVPQDIEEKKKWQKVADEMQDVQWDPTIPFYRNMLYEVLIGFWKRIWIFRFKRRELSEY